jgi:uncharacterized protein YjbJ (UPF0337 family)
MGRFCAELGDNRAIRRRGTAVALPPSSQGANNMNWDQVEGQFKQIGAKIKQKWAKLTDDDLKLIGGKKDELIGRLQLRYGWEKDRAESEVDGFMDTVDQDKGRTTH